MRFKITKILTLLYLATLFSGFQSQAQSNLEVVKRLNYNISQTTLGIDYRYTPSDGRAPFINTNGTQEYYDLGNSSWGRFIISGWYFSGILDIYLAIPVIKIQSPSFSQNGKAYYNNGVETGFKVYPYKIKDKKLRPFLGVSFNNTVFWQESDGVKNQYLSRNTFPLQTGLTFVRGRNIIDLGLTFNFQTESNYYITTTKSATVSLPKYNLALGWRTYLGNLNNRRQESGDETEVQEEQNRDNKASGLSLGLGVSSAFYIGNYFNLHNYPYLGDLRFSNPFMDLGLGYYFTKPNIQANIAYRSYKTKFEAFETKETYQRTTIGLEVYKFLMDKKGFAPFVGPIVSLDRNAISVDINGNSTLEHQESSIRYGITFGFDIRQEKNPWLLLRTNIRYYPAYNLDLDLPAINFNQLEFNIIQAVFYPSTYIKVKRKGRI